MGGDKTLPQASQARIKSVDGDDSSTRSRRELSGTPNGAHFLPWDDCDFSIPCFAGCAVCPFAVPFQWECPSTYFMALASTAVSFAVFWWGLTPPRAPPRCSHTLMSAGVVGGAAVSSRLAAVRQQRRQSNLGLANMLDNAHTSTEVKKLRQRLASEGSVRNSLAQKTQSQPNPSIAASMMSSFIHGDVGPAQVVQPSSTMVTPRLIDLQELTTEEATSPDKEKHARDEGKEMRKDKVGAVFGFGCGSVIKGFWVRLAHAVRECTTSAF